MYQDKIKFCRLVINTTKSASLPKSFCFSLGFHLLIIIIFVLLTLYIKTFEVFPVKKEMTYKDIEFILTKSPVQKSTNKKTKFFADKNLKTAKKKNTTKKRSVPKPLKKTKKQVKTLHSKPLKVNTTLAQRKKSLSKSIIKKSSKKIVKDKKQIINSKKNSNLRKIASNRSKVAKVTKNETLQKQESNISEKNDFSKVIQETQKVYTSKENSNLGKIISDRSKVAKVAKNEALQRQGSNISEKNDFSKAGQETKKASTGIGNEKNVDFKPYMNKLQRKIKREWEPPRGKESRKTVLLFRIAKNGHLVSLKIHKSSGNPRADRAALYAVKRAQPFMHLPDDYTKNYADIVFAFDSRVFNLNGIQR